MASSFGDDPFGGDRAGGANPQPPPAEAEAAPVSPAQERFLSCRWRRPAESGGADWCGHRDVLPVAGTTGFQAEAWCRDCSLYKAKRAPRKREERHPPAVDDYWRR